MAEQFRFALEDAEKLYLKNLVKLSILDVFRTRDEDPVPPPVSKRLLEPFGAFVTLKKGGNLRGCIGNVQGGGPLFQTIWQMARSAAFRDPRFPPLVIEELAEVDIEISILSPLEECPDPEKIEVGRHGLIMCHGGHSGLLLPQVPLEWGWGREKFLDQTCLKAGLTPGAWKDPRTKILWFEAEVFS